MIALNALKAICYRVCAVPSSMQDDIYKYKKRMEKAPGGTSEEDLDEEQPCS